jgi:hypothetical protein
MSSDEVLTLRDTVRCPTDRLDELAEGKGNATDIDRLRGEGGSRTCK